MSGQNDESELSEALKDYKLSELPMTLSTVRTADEIAVRVSYRAIGRRPVSVSMTSLRPGAGGSGEGRGGPC